MESSAEIAQTLLKLSAAAIFANNSTALDRIEWDLSSRDFRGLAVNTVSEIDVRQHDSLPLVIASQFDAIRDWETPLSENLALVVFEHDTAEVKVATPFAEDATNRPDFGPPTTRPAKPTGDAATGVATSVRTVDVRKLFGLDWHNHQLSLFAVSFDVVSNEAKVAIIGGRPPATPLLPRVNPPLGLTAPPSYDPATLGIEPPDDGVNFDVSVADKPDVIVRGALLTHALPRHLLPEPIAMGPRRVAAVVPVTFLLVGRNWNVPWVFEWAVPVWGDHSIAPGAPLSAAFAIPLPQDKVQILAAGTYSAYVVLEGRMFGPVELTIVDAIE